MDIAKMREDLENYCKGKCCEKCPLDDICSTGRYWSNEKEEDIIELWKTAFPNKSIPVTEEEKRTVSETLSLKSQITQQEKAYATLMDQFNKLQREKNGLQKAIKIKDETIALLESNLESKTKEIDSKDNSQALAEKQIVKMRECIDSQNDTIHSLVEEKKKLVEKRIAAEKTAEDAAKTEDNLLNSLNALGDANAQLRRKNSQIISAVADLFKRIMEE